MILSRKLTQELRDAGIFLGNHAPETARLQLAPRIRSETWGTTPRLQDLLLLLLPPAGSNRPGPAGGPGLWQSGAAAELPPAQAHLRAPTGPRRPRGKRPGLEYGAGDPDPCSCSRGDPGTLGTPPIWGPPTSTGTPSSPPKDTNAKPAARPRYPQGSPHPPRDPQPLGFFLRGEPPGEERGRGRGGGEGASPAPGPHSQRRSHFIQW